jgi:HAD superfamily hydrolase (TIGR01549 family)
LLIIFSEDVIDVNILWDFDGTILDTYPVYTKLFKQVLNSDVDEQAIFAQIKVSFQTAYAYFNMTPDQIRTFHQLIREYPSSGFNPFPSVEKVLASADKNVIMTHNNRVDLVRILRQYGLENYFAEMVTSDNGFPKKPDPAAYIYLDAHQGFDLAIGDRTLDIIPAKKLGKKTCLFQNDTPGADFYLSNYDEFFDRVRL